MVSLGLLIIRSVVGAVFVVHGYPKLFGGPGKTVSAETERVLGKRFADHMAHVCFSQFVAVEKVHGRHGLVADKGYEENALLIAATAGLALAGPGALALD
jgi:putative oxidoreductase